MLHKIIAVSLAFLLLGGLVLGVPLGTTFTQEQVNSFTEEQIKSNLSFVDKRIHFGEKGVEIFLTLRTMNKDKNVVVDVNGIAHDEVKANTGLYKVTQKERKVWGFTYEQAIRCVLQYDKSTCWNNIIVPKVVDNAIMLKKREFLKIKNWQEEEESPYTQQEIEDALDLDQLNNVDYDTEECPNCGG